MIFKIFFVAFSLLFLEANAQCKRCEDLRRFHEAHPEENYEYYDDYLKEQETKSPVQQPANSEKNSPS